MKNELNKLYTGFNLKKYFHFKQERKAKTKDPRTHITATSLNVSEDLLGTPLASPRRRAAAILIDLLIIWLIAELVGALVGIIIGIVVFKFIRRKRNSNGKVSFSRNVFAFLSASVFFSISFSASDSLSEKWDSLMSNPEQVSSAITINEVKKDSIKQIEKKKPLTKTKQFHLPDTEQTFQTYITAYQNENKEDIDSLSKLLREYFAGKQISKLKKKNRELDEEIDELDEEIEQLEANLAEVGIIGFLKKSLDDLGIGLGWIGVYFIAANVFWRGQTPGKKLMKIQVVRLNGQAIDFWYSFERFGGYAAGVVTGLLGFAQVYWDNNRQAVHDKIAGTVVINLKKDKVQTRYNEFQS